MRTRSAEPGGSGGAGSAGRLSAALRGYGQLPGLRIAALSSLVAVAVVIAAALLVVVLVPQESFVDLSAGGEASFWQQVLNQASGMTLARFDLQFGGFFFPPEFAASIRLSPLLFAAFPLGGCLLGAYLTAGRRIAMPGRLQLLWGVGTAIPFALAMWLLAILAGTTADGGLSPSQESVFLLSLLWGALGGALGAGLAMRRDRLGVGLSDRGQRCVAFARAVVVPLALALAVAAAIGTAVLLVETVRDSNGVRGERSLATALADDAFFAGDLGLRYLALGSGSRLRAFDPEVGRTGASPIESAELVDEAGVPLLPIPVSAASYAGFLAGEDGTDPTFTIFTYDEQLGRWALLSVLIALTVVPGLLAAAAGFRAARAMKPASARRGAAWGAAVGPAWALATAGLVTLSQDFRFGQFVGDGMPVIVLLAGAVLGALGGYLASRRLGVRAAPSPPA